MIPLLLGVVNIDSFDDGVLETTYLMATSNTRSPKDQSMEASKHTEQTGGGGGGLMIQNDKRMTLVRLRGMNLQIFRLDCLLRSVGGMEMRQRTTEDKRKETMARRGGLTCARSWQSHRSRAGELCKLLLCYEPGSIG